MYENTGAKIKSFAKAMAIIEIIFVLIVGFIAMGVGASISDYSGDSISLYIFFGGMLFCILGCLFAWFKFLFLAGFGELIEETTKSSAELHEIKELLSNNRCESSESTYNIESQEQE